MTVTASLIALLLAASLRSSTVTGKLSAVVTPANSSADGSDWCQPLKPCNETKTNSAQIESIYGLGLLTKKTTASSTYQYADVTPATAVDWRTVLTNWTVRDQGTCGSCYAFAASGSLEALIAITRDANVTSELSEAQLVDCLPTADVGCDSNGDCDGCQGGDPDTALAYALSEWDGLASAAVYPYGTLIDSDTAGTCINERAEAGTSFMSVQRVPTTTLALKQAVTNQPVVVGVDASDWSAVYTSEQGIYNGSCTTSTLNHALIVVGYSEMSTGEEYWILRNQWGADWGADGYIYLAISSDDDTTGGACGLLGVNNAYPPVYPSMSNSTSGAIQPQLLSVLLAVPVFAVLLLTL